MSIKSKLKEIYFKAAALGRTIPIAQHALVLNYHHIVPAELMEPNLLFGYSHSIENFEKQMEWLLKHYEPLSEPSKEGGFMVTFDDCSLATFENATPILDKLGIKGHFFIVEEALDQILWIDKYFCWISYVPFDTYTLNKTTFTITTDSDRKTLHSLLWKMIASGMPAGQLIELMNNSYAFKELSDIQLKLKKTTSMSWEERNPGAN